MFALHLVGYNRAREMFLVAPQLGGDGRAGREQPPRAAITATAARRLRGHLPGLRREPRRSRRLQGTVLRPQRRLPGTHHRAAQV